MTCENARNVCCVRSRKHSTRQKQDNPHRNKRDARTAAFYRGCRWSCGCLRCCGCVIRPFGATVAAGDPDGTNAGSVSAGTRSSARAGTLRGSGHSSAFATSDAFAAGSRLRGLRRKCIDVCLGHARLFHQIKTLQRLIRAMHFPFAGHSSAQRCLKLLVLFPCLLASVFKPHAFKCHAATRLQVGRFGNFRAYLRKVMALLLHIRSKTTLAIAHAFEFALSRGELHQLFVDLGNLRHNSRMSPTLSAIRHLLGARFFQQIHCRFEIARAIGVVHQIAQFRLDISRSQRVGKAILRNVRAALKRIGVQPEQRNAWNSTQLVGTFSRNLIEHRKRIILGRGAKTTLNAVQTSARVHNQLAAVRAPLPGSVTTPQIFVQVTLVMTRHSVQHAANKCRKRSFARTVRLLNNRQAVVEIERALTQPAKILNCAAH